MEEKRELLNDGSLDQLQDFAKSDNNDEQLLSRKALGVIPFLLFEELDVVFRFTIFIALYTGIYLQYYEWGRQELPLVYVGLNIVTALSRISFVGGFLSYSLSFLLGSVVSIFVVLLLTSICGTNIVDITYDKPTTDLTCIYDSASNTYEPSIVTVFSTGDLGDPNTVLLSILLFLITFLMLFAGRSNPWTKGAVITLNIYTAIWFLGMKDQSIPIPDIGDYFLILRSTSVAMAFYLFCLLIPLPKLFPTFVPQPRLSTTTILVAMKSLQKDIALVAQSISDNYRNLISENFDESEYNLNDDHNLKDRPDPTLKKRVLSVPISTQLFLSNKISNMISTILKMKFLMKESAQWEAFWWTLPFSHCISTLNMVKYITKFHIAVHHCRMMVNALKYLKLTEDSSFQSVIPMNGEEVERLLEKSNYFIQASYLEGHSFSRCDQVGGFSRKKSTYNDYVHDHEIEELVSHFQSNLFKNENIPLHLFERLNVEQNISSDQPLTAQLPIQIVNLFFIWNFLSFLKITSDLKKISDNLPDSPENEIITEKSADPQKYFYESSASFQFLLRNWAKQILEHIVRLCRWVLLYIADWWFLAKNFMAVVVHRNDTYQYRRVSRKSYLLEKAKHLFSSFVIALSASLGLMFIFVDYLRINTPSSLIIVVTIVTSVEPENPGTAINRSISRLSGTAIGISLSYLLLAISKNDKIAIYIGSILFALIGRFLMGRERFSDMSASFLTTSWIIMYSGSLDLPSNLLLANLAEKGISVGIGIVIAFAVLFLWPINPHVQLKYNIVKYILLDLSYSLKKIFAKPIAKSFTSEYDQRKVIVEESNARTIDINLHNELLIESREEVHFLFAYSFPFNEFSDFIELERNLTSDVFSLDMISHMLESNLQYSKEHLISRVQFYQILKCALQEICDKTLRGVPSDSDITFQLKQAYAEYVKSLHKEFSNFGNSERINIIRLYSMVYLFAKMIDTISVIDYKAEEIAAFNLANKPRGFGCFDK